MAQTTVKEESATPTPLAAEFRLTGKGWVEDDYCTIPVFDGRSQDTSHQTYDLRCAQTAFPQSSEGGKTGRRANDGAGSSPEYEARPQYCLYTSVFEPAEHHDTTLE